MPFDRDADAGVLLQPRGLALQDLLRLRRDVRLVVSEEHAVPDGRREIMLRPRPELRSIDAAGTAKAARLAHPAGAARRRLGAAAAGGKQQRRRGKNNYTSVQDQPLNRCGPVDRTKPQRLCPLSPLPFAQSTA